MKLIDTNPQAPGDMSPETFRAAGYRVVDMIAEYFGTLPGTPVTPATSPSAVAGLFDEGVPEHGQHPDAVLDAWRARVLPNLTHVGSPRYFGYVMGSGSMMAVLAEALAASVNQNVGVWKASPAGTEIERRTVAWLAELIGYAPSAGGLFTSGGTMANLSAVLAALRRAAGAEVAASGLQDPERRGRYLMYMADHEAHVSFRRAAEMAGLGHDAVRLVPSRDDFTMDVDALERLLDEDAAAGDVPFLVVGHVGSINVGAIDPLPAIAAVCRSRGLWFHADGACGAFGAMLPELRHAYRGLEEADSITLDPHKWLAIPYECGCLLARDPQALRRTFSMSAAYLHGSLPEAEAELDLYEYGPQMSRSFRALKVWMALKQRGAEGYRELLRNDLRCARHLDRLVRSSREFERLHEPTLYIVSFRYAPERYRTGASAAAEGEAFDGYLDWLNQAVADALRADGTAFVMTTRVRGRVVLRLSICSHRTTLADIERVFEAIRTTGSRLDRERAAVALPRAI